MKKLILGLCLTVGASASVFANQEMAKNKNITKAISDCEIRTRVVTVDSQGHVLADQTYTTCGSGDECEGAIDGLKLVIKRTKIKGIQP